MAKLSQSDIKSLYFFSVMAGGEVKSGMFLESLNDDVHNGDLFRYLQRSLNNQGCSHMRKKIEFGFEASYFIRLILSHLTDCKSVDIERLVTNVLTIVL